MKVFTKFLDNLTTFRVVHVIIAIGLLTFANSLFNGFVLDDESQLLSNQIVHSLSNFFHFFGGSTFDNGGSGKLIGIFYRPIVSVSFAAIYSLFGPNPFPFHLVQLCLHIVNSLLVFLLFRSFFKPKISFFLSLVFLVHPINQEAVVYIANLQETLFLFFGTVAFLCAKNGLTEFKTIVKVNIFLLLALFSKETAILFIPLIILYQLLFNKRNFSLPKISTIFITLGFYLLMRTSFAHVNYGHDPNIPIMNISLFERVTNMPAIAAYYLEKFFFPKDLIVFQYWLINDINFNQFFFPLIMIVLFLICLVLLGWIIFMKQKTQFPTFLFFSSWFLLGIAVHLQFIPLEFTVADRWFYFPIVGLLGLTGLLFNTIHTNKKILKNSFLVCSILIIFLLGIRTIIRNSNWSNGLTLYNHDSKLSPNNPVLENNLGVELLRNNQISEANGHFKKAVKLQPFNGNNWLNLGLSSERLGDYQHAKNYYLKAIQLGHEAAAYDALGGGYLFYDNDSKTASKILYEGLQRYSLNQRLNLLYAVAQYNLGNKEEALKFATRAYQISPNQDAQYIFYQIRNNLPISLK